MDSRIISTLFVVCVLVMIYRYFIRPIRIMHNYATLLRRMGYKVLHESFNPFKQDIFQAINRGVREGDAMKVFKFERG